MKKLFVVVPVVIILIALIVIGVIANNNIKYEIEEITEYNYFKFHQKQYLYVTLIIILNKESIKQKYLTKKMSNYLLYMKK